MKKRIAISILVVQLGWGQALFRAQNRVISVAPVTCSGYSHYSAITLPTPASTLTNIPIVAKGTLAALKTVANGGNLQGTETISTPYSHAVPADFILKDTDGTTLLGNFEFPMYVATTGEYELWINYPSLTTGAGTIYACFGNAAVTTFQGNSDATWNSAYMLVAHLQDGTTLGAQDSATNNTPTLNGTPTATTGKIDGGIALAAASSQYVTYGDIAPTDPTAMTISAWVNATSFPDAATVAGRGGGGYFLLRVRTDGKLTCESHKASYDGTGSNTLSTSTWYHLAMTYDSSAGLVCYVNGASDGTAAANGTLDSAGGSHFLLGFQLSTSRYWDGVLDELHVSNVARSADWIALEHSNQATPATLGAATAF